MGGTSADFAKSKDWTSKKWMARAWQDKLAAGFPVSASWGADKQNTINQLFTLAAQLGMVWVGLGLPPGNNHSKGSPEDLNRTGASLGLMAQANALAHAALRRGIPKQSQSSLAPPEEGSVEALDIAAFPLAHVPEPSLSAPKRI